MSTETATAETTDPTTLRTEADVLRVLGTVLDDIEETVLTSYTLADAMREGSTVTTQAFNWGEGGAACALSAARLAARARGYL